MLVLKYLRYSIIAFTVVCVYVLSSSIYSAEILSLLIFNQALSLKKRNLGTSTYAWITDWVTHCETTAHVTTTLAATLATGMPVAFATNGTVRLARGLTSST